MSSARQFEKTRFISKILMGCIVCFGVLSAVFTLYQGEPSVEHGEISADTRNLQTLSTESLEEFKEAISDAEAASVVLEGALDSKESVKDSRQVSGTVLFSSQKELVQAIQKELNRQGYAVGSEDGLMGPRTRNGIRQFEEDNRIAESGEPSEELYSLLAAQHNIHH